MYYKIKANKRVELQNGRTLTYFSKICNYSRQYITYVFNGKCKATKESAEKIIKCIAKDSIKISEKIKKEGLQKTLDYFFEEVN